MLFNQYSSVCCFLSGHEIHDGESGDEIEAWQDLFQEVEHTAEHTFGATKTLVKYQR